MHKIILAFGLVLLLITGCKAHNKAIEDPVKAELLKPAPPVTVETDADKEQSIEDKNKDNEESKGVAYYLTVGVGTVFYTGLYVLSEIVSH